MKLTEDAEFIRETVMKHQKWFEESLPMIASENLASPLAREMLISDLHDRYAEGWVHERYYNGNIYVDELEERIMKMARELFGSKFADVRPISGTVANMAVIFGFTKPGDTIITPALSDGAHISSAKFGAVGFRGVSTVNYPFDRKEMITDVDGAKKLILEQRPKLCLFGRSVFLFPEPLKELQPTLEEVGCTVWYDAAHVLGLIAGKQFQDPLREGAHIISGSTHKTLPGPQHGIILANPKNDKMERKLKRGVFPGVTSNHHLHAMAALGIALAEHKEFGEAYAKQTIRNAQALGEALYERGIPVLCEHKGFTASHTIAVDVSSFGGGELVANNMEKANMITNKNLLPEDTSPKHPSGIRLGTQELTRVGIKEKNMAEVAELIARVVKGEDPLKVKEDVKELKKDFTKIHYCFASGEEAYRYYKLV